MEIVTRFGTFEFDDDFLNEHTDLSPEALKVLERVKKVSFVTFQSKGDMTTDLIEKNFMHVIYELREVVYASKYSDPSRAFAIIELLNGSFDDLEEKNDVTFEFEGGEYKVLTDDEADEEWKSYLEDLVSQMDIDDLSDGVSSHIYANCVDGDWFDRMMNDSNTDYANEFKNEDASSDEYINRLHEEMVSEGILDEPEWPEEPEDEEQYDEYEAEKEKYKEELEKEIDSKFDDYVESLNSNYDSGIDYFKENFGDKEFTRTARENNLIDEDAVVKYLINIGDRGQDIGYYDGEENDVTFTYRGETYQYFIYRVG